MTVLSDAADRERAIHERERNVLVDASAGTGKTKLVVDRLLELVAPSAGGVPIPIERVAPAAAPARTPASFTLNRSERKSAPSPSSSARTHSAIRSRGVSVCPARP